MKKNMPKATDPKPELDKAKRVYRAALDTIRKLDEISKQKKAYRDVFMPEAINLRSKLQDYCERLMFFNPVDYGRKAEELLWRKVYYDVIQLMKHNRKQMRPSSSLESAFRTHLASATGYYHHLLIKIQGDFSLKMEGVIDFFHVPEPKAHRKPHQARKAEPDPAVQEWARKACHRCLIYLGDLARYQQDYDGMRSRVMSQRYYFQALALLPDLGMPHNQLGTLAGTRYYNLDAAYYYLRCLVCGKSFEGAEGNLNRLLEKNRRRHTDLLHITQRDLPPEQQRSKDIKRFVVRFMHLLDMLRNNGSKVDPKAVQDACQAALQDFNLCMFYQPPHVTNPSASHPGGQHCIEDKLYYLEDEMVFKIVVICLMTIYLLQREGDKLVTAAIAFSLALFSHVLNHVVIRLQSALYELENPRKVLQVDSGEDKNTTTTDADEDSSQEKRPRSRKASSTEKDPQDAEKAEKRKQKLQKMRRRRRRRRGSNSSSGSDSSSRESAESDNSEGEEVASEDESEDEMNFLQQSESSESDSDDNLKVSQELTPGFSTREMALGESMEASQSDIDKGLQSGLDSLNSSFNSTFNNSIFSDLKNMNANANAVDESRAKPPAAPLDMTEFLRDFPTDWLSDTNNFLTEALKFNAPNMSQPGMPDVDLDNMDLEVSNQNLNDVAQGKKQVSVPPGFETSDESQHVLEITEKMNNFMIETDTDTSNIHTDTENSTINTESEMDTETETDRESVIDKTELEENRMERLVQVIGKEGLLSSIKIYCDWMRCNSGIISTCAKSSQSLWSRLSVLLNFLPLESDLAKLSLCKSEGVYKMVQSATQREWKPSQPLTEDIHLLNFLPLEEAHTSLDFDVQKRLDLSVHQEAILRICYLKKFGYFIAKVKHIRFSFDKEKSMFYSTVPVAPTQDEKSAQEKMADAQARRNQLMKDMAQLRLQAEVSQLEGSLQSTDQPNLPPYLVPDAASLSAYLSQIKQLANSSRFIIIIPLAVIDHLDLLKKESVGARDAIRWLEAEFKKGNRYVRAQKNHEKTATLPLKNLKKKDKDAWRFIQICDCGKYLSQQGTDSDPHGMVCILSDHKVASHDISIRVKHAISTAQQEGITVQSAADFYTKWKEVWKNNKTCN